jgi:hypothetical protein
MIIRSHPEPIFFHNFHNHNLCQSFLSHTNDDVSLFQINAWLDSLVTEHPGVVTSIVGGVSFQGRQIRGVQVTFRPDNPVVFFEGGMSPYPTIYSAFLH